MSCPYQNNEKPLRYWEQPAKPRQTKGNKILENILVFSLPIIIIFFISFGVYFWLKMANKNSAKNNQTVQEYCKDYPGNKNDCIISNSEIIGQYDSLPEW